MKVMFIVQGEGRGHLTQALSLATMLRENGHELVGVMVGKSQSRRVPEFFTNKIGCGVDMFESPNFLPTANNKRVNLTRSILYNLMHLPKYARSVVMLNKAISNSGADLVVNFYELMTGITYMLSRPKVRMICIAHQYLFLHKDFELPKQGRVQLGMLNFFSRLTSAGASKMLALSFRRMASDKEHNIYVVPPVLRKEVMALRPYKGGYLHGYMVNSGYGEEILRWHRSNSHVPLHIFWDKKNAGKLMRVDDTLSFHQLDDKLFLEYMAGADGYATTAGFESVCEAMYMGKPVLMIPSHIEQSCNAFDAVNSGAGVVCYEFNIDKLLAAVNSYTPDPMFRHWVSQSEWMIMSELMASQQPEMSKMVPVAV